MRRAIIEMPKPMTSEAMCAASDMIAIELAKIPPVISMAMKMREVRSTIISFLVAFRFDSMASWRFFSYMGEIISKSESYELERLASASSISPFCCMMRAWRCSAVLDKSF